MNAWFKKLLGKKSITVDAGLVTSYDVNDASVRSKLATDQARLGEEIEEMFRAYDSRLMSLAQRVNSLSEADLARETESIRQSQDSLRRIIRRFQAGLKSTTDLDQELDGWDGHPQDEGALLADHPLVRAEIARSELILRDEERLRKQKTERAHLSMNHVGYKHEDLDIEKNTDSEQILNSIPNTATEMLHIQVHHVDPVRYPDENQLIAAIRDAVRETNRWHAKENTEFTQDAVDQVRQLKYLHGILKRLDLQKGIRRDRSVYWPDMHI
ncbi:hypothetical protein IT408_03715 [Candidatus Uhrbacteria bacterium]|nr:hypothetical protein [Candidatus Uhrbacteria bacterium]